MAQIAQLERASFFALILTPISAKFESAKRERRFLAAGPPLEFSLHIQIGHITQQPLDHLGQSLFRLSHLVATKSRTSWIETDSSRQIRHILEAQE